ncbi:MAG: hypothetical protein R3B41_03845 [Candidatus Doudnabacteria bacterium]
MKRRVIFLFALMVGIGSTFLAIDFESNRQNPISPASADQPELPNLGQAEIAWIIGQIEKRPSLVKFSDSSRLIFEVESSTHVYRGVVNRLERSLLLSRAERGENLEAGVVSENWTDIGADGLIEGASSIECSSNSWPRCSGQKLNDREHLKLIHEYQSALMDLGILLEE